MHGVRVRVEKKYFIPSSHRAMAWTSLLLNKVNSLDCGKASGLSGCLDWDAAFSVNSACPDPEDLRTLKKVQTLLPGEGSQ